MFLANIGEIEFIRKIREQWADAELPAGLIGIGDDCAVFPLNNQFDGLVTTDLLIEKIHFTSETVSMWELGAKAIEVNVSDIAAMGGQPLYATISLAVHADTEILDLETLYRGLFETARAHSIVLVGGDTSNSPGLMYLNLTLIGRVEKGKALLRSNAQAGDLVCVSGSLGDSHLGLNWLLSGLKKSDVCSNGQDSLADMIDYCCKRHALPQSRVALGHLLCTTGLARACIDLSDGLATDLEHICCESKVSARIELERLPMHPKAREMARILSIDPIKAMTTGGEDYELLFTIPAERQAELSAVADKIGTNLTVIGSITDKPGPIEYTLDGRVFDYNLTGYDHFRTV
ncbi:thiamine-phosphate kinase [bacterium]|nr:thiamine-phosphate kinase [bacterium]